MTNTDMPIAGWLCFNGAHIVRDPAVPMEFNAKDDGATTAYCPEHPPTPSYDTRMDPCSPDFDPSSWLED